MKEGILRRDWPDGSSATVAIGPAGWRPSSPADASLAEMVAALYPIPSTVVGTPWVQAFWQAVQGLHATVVQEPVLDAEPPDRIY